MPRQEALQSANVSRWDVIRRGFALNTMVFSLEPTAPFRLDLTAWALRRQSDNIVDRWDGRTYRRVLVLQGRPVQVAVTQVAPSERPQIKVAVTGTRLARDLQPAVTAELERLLAIRVDLTDFYRFASREANLQPLVERFRGFKPPQFQTVFEALANAISCQQVTLLLGIRLLSRLAGTYGLSLPQPGSLEHAFPLPESLARRRVTSLRGIGLSRQKARALIEASRSVAHERFGRSALEALDDAAAVQRLCELRGVGRWTAEYVLLRGLGRLHVFPGDDVGARNHLQSWQGLKKPLDYDEVRRIVGEWHPYAGLIYFHLLLKRLAEKQLLPV